MAPRAQRAAALVLVATPIGNLGDLSPRALAELRDADLIAAEDTRRTRQLLSHAGIPGGDRLIAVHDHNEAEMAPRIVAEIQGGRRVVYVSDAGMPGVSDPGERLVRACAEEDLLVEVVPGPSAVLSALVVSGLPGERFVFEGFLPTKGKRRSERIDALAAEERTTVLFEAPHRLERTLADLAAVLGPDRRLAIVRELTKRHEEVWRGSLGETVPTLPVEARGEVVVVLGPAAPAPAPDDDAVRAALEEALAAGSSARDAAAEVAGNLGVAKRRAYEMAIDLRGRSTGEPPPAESQSEADGAA